MKKGVDFVGISINYFCMDGKGRFLMAKRTNNCRDEWGKWDTGGGGLEVGDTIEETLRKEIKEEYCTDVLSFEFLGHSEVFREHEGMKTHWLAMQYKVLVDPEKVANGEPHKFSQLEWFTLDSLPPASELHSQLPKAIERYKGKLN
ncbi:MAG: NUDIX hydrolase [Patescibacteria group bacterium]